MNWPAVTMGHVVLSGRKLRACQVWVSTTHGAARASGRRAEHPANSRSQTGGRSTTTAGDAIGAVRDDLRPGQARASRASSP
jgi:hypothetical protein